ncbi:MAG: hypothetical protein K6C97_04565 [Treponema sp.]|nr:hypothetical protein [Treponema sp.]
MNLKKLFLALSIFTLIFSPAFTDEVDQVEEEKSPWAFSIATDFAFYPKSDYVAGGSHFAPITGFYSGLEGRVTGNASYTIPTPLGDHWLLASANLALKGSFELSPVSLKPGIEASFTPLPFLVFSAGAQAGSGWTLAGLQGMAGFNGITAGTYTDYNFFQTWYLKWYAQGTFQFDTGAIFPGDWTHFQIMYSYQLYYEKLSSAADGEIWMWQCTGNKVNGFKNYQNLILAYSMPLLVSRVGVLCELDGYYQNEAYTNPNYNGAFKTISISPMAQFTFGPKDVLTVLLGFSSRRSFTTGHSQLYEETGLTYAGREWFFNRIALSWTHSF